MNKLKLRNSTFALTPFLAILILAGAGCFGAPEQSTIAPQEEQLNPVVNNPSEELMQLNPPTILPVEQIEGKYARLQTEKGEIVIELFADTAPLTVSNFVTLTNSEYYDGLTFHRREEGFVIQGGDPSGNGTGGPGYTFADELSDDYAYARGIVAMANRGPNTNGSQFFVMLNTVPLDKSYTIFGNVVEGMDVVDAIRVGDAMTKVTIEDKK